MTSHPLDPWSAVAENDLDWNVYKERIHDLYLVQGLTLNKLHHWLIHDQRKNVSRHQLTYQLGKWKFHKKKSHKRPSHLVGIQNSASQRPMSSASHDRQSLDFSNWVYIDDHFEDEEDLEAASSRQMPPIWLDLSEKTPVNLGTMHGPSLAASVTSSQLTGLRTFKSTHRRSQVRNDVGAEFSSALSARSNDASSLADLTAPLVTKDDIICGEETALFSQPEDVWLGLGFHENLVLGWEEGRQLSDSLTLIGIGSR